MIAADMSAHKFSFAVMGRDFFFSLRKFIKINARRLITNSESVTGRLLYFRHVIYKYKLMAYFQKYKAIVKNHEAILKFKESCELAQIAKQEEAAYTPRFTFASKLFRQLQ